MSIAAVPSYLGQDFKGASPGMRFGMYLQLWGINRRTRELLWKTHDVDYEVRGQNRQEREVKYENKVSAIKAAARLSTTEKKLMEALLKRQTRAFDAVSDDTAKIRLPAIATAPFTTGLGNEHPLENGFAFLNPYGLPYLPGSGVKGVLRQAARELASGDWGETHGWDAVSPRPASLSRGGCRKPFAVGGISAAHPPNSNAPPDALRLSGLPIPAFTTTSPGERDLNARPSPSGESAAMGAKLAGGEGLAALDALFGRESADGGTDHLRGALSFWDVIPQIKGDSLMVEIMTPHQSHYYQQKPAAGSTSPHDSGQPNPISYLTVPPGSGFTFHVVCDLAHLEWIAPDLAREGRWKTLVTAAFKQAFAWCGFGAKTAVGYGAMQEDPAVAAERARRQADEHAERERQAEADRVASLSPDEQAWEAHQPVIAEFQKVFDEAKSTPYQPGSAFDQERLYFMGKALAWTDARSRGAAADLLAATLTKAWGTPGKKESRQRLKDAIVQLSGSLDSGDG